MFSPGLFPSALRFQPGAYSATLDGCRYVRVAPQETDKIGVGTTLPAPLGAVPRDGVEPCPAKGGSVAAQSGSDHPSSRSSARRTCVTERGEVNLGRKKRRRARRRAEALSGRLTRGARRG